MNVVTLFSQMYLKRHEFKSLKLIGKYSDIDKWRTVNCGFMDTLKKEKRGGGKLKRRRLRRVRQSLYFEREL